MSPSRTAAESKADHIARMGEGLGCVYHALWQEVAWIYKKWAEYVTLFGTNPGRIELMNQSAPSFFRTVQDSMWESVLLHIARLTDSPRSRGKSNLSLKRLPGELAASPIGDEVARLVSVASTQSDFARDWRNRHLAHRDLALALGQQVEPLAHASRAAVRQALAAMAAVLNSVSGHYLDSTTMFDLGDDGGDAVSMLYLLRDGARYEQDRIVRLKAGTYLPGDLKHEPV